MKKKRCFCFVFLLSLTFDSTVNSESLNHTAKYNQNQSMLAYASTIMEFTVVALVCCCCCYFFSRLRKFGEVISDILTTQSWHFAFCMCVYGCMLLDFFLISIRFFLLYNLAKWKTILIEKCLLIFHTLKLPKSIHIPP